MIVHMDFFPCDFVFLGLPDSSKKKLVNDMAEIAGRVMDRSWAFRVSGCMAYPGDFGSEVSSFVWHEPL